MLSGSLILLLVSSFPQTQGSDRPALRLTLRGAVEIAAENSARVRIAEELAEQTDRRVGPARAALLPNVDAQVSHSSQTRNLQAFGLRLAAPVPGISIPTFVGPFNVIDARLTGTQTILNLSTLRRYQASKAARGAAGSEVAALAE